MSIPNSAIPTPIVSPTAAGKDFITSNPNSQAPPQLSGTARLALQQMHDYVVNMCRTFPCNSSTTNNVITLTLLTISPSLVQYADYDSFRFVADASTSGTVTALVVTNVNNNATSLATLPVYKNNGGTAAGNGDITSGNQYDFTFVDSLNSGNGGFVMR